MKNTLLIIWNVLLTAASLFLLFHVLVEDKEEGKGNPDPKNIAKTEITADTSGALRIAYVNIDSLEYHYELFSKKKKELEAKQRQSEDLFEKKMTDFQNDYTAAQQSAATMTESQLMATQESLQKQQAELRQLQDALQTDFQTQLDKFNVELKDSLDSFMKTYNADKRFAFVFSYSESSEILFAQPQYDITADAIKGMNERLKKDDGK